MDQRTSWKRNAAAVERGWAPPASIVMRHGVDLDLFDLGVRPRNDAGEVLLQRDARDVGTLRDHAQDRAKPFHLLPLLLLLVFPWP
jgi:hypothetical protein